MNVTDLALSLDLALARHRDRGGSPDDEHALVLTLLGPSTRGMGIRPLILEVREDGTRVMGITARMATRWRKKISPAVLVDMERAMKANSES